MTFYIPSTGTGSSRRILQGKLSRADHAGSPNNWAPAIGHDKSSWPCALLGRRTWHKIVPLALEAMAATPTSNPKTIMAWTRWKAAQHGGYYYPGRRRSWLLGARVAMIVFFFFFLLPFLLFLYYFVYLTERRFFTNGSDYYLVPSRAADVFVSPVTNLGFFFLFLRQPFRGTAVMMSYGKGNLQRPRRGFGNLEIQTGWPLGARGGGHCVR